MVRPVDASNFDAAAMTTASLFRGSAVGLGCGAVGLGRAATAGVATARVATAFCRRCVVVFLAGRFDSVVLDGGAGLGKRSTQRGRNFKL